MAKLTRKKSRNKLIRRKSQKQEARTAKDFGGSVQIASGAIWTMKADVRTGGDKGKRGSGFNDSDFLIENKFTDADFYKLERKIWKKIKEEALRDNMRMPMMQIDVKDMQLAVLDCNDFIALTENEELITKIVNTNKNSYRLRYDYLEEEINHNGSVNIETFIQLNFQDTRSNLQQSLVIMQKESMLALL